MGQDASDAMDQDLSPKGLLALLEHPEIITAKIRPELSEVTVDELACHDGVGIIYRHDMYEASRNRFQGDWAPAGRGSVWVSVNQDVYDVTCKSPAEGKKRGNTWDA